MESNVKQASRQAKACSTFKRASFIILFSVACCLLPFALQAQQGNASANIENGRRIFTGSCSMGYCHGLNGAGGGGPKLAGRKLSVRHLTMVINDGVAETPMPGFKDKLTKEQLADLIAYVQSLAAGAATESEKEPAAEHLPTAGNKPETKSATTAVAKPVVITAEDRELMGNAAAGRELFFGAGVITNCRVCHTVSGIGGQIGPDLTGLAAQSAKDILQSITAPHIRVDEKYAAFVVTLKNGQRFTGVRRDEDETTLRLYDTSSLPPISRAFLKSEIAMTEKLKTSPMPADYGTKYSRRQLLDLVGFLKTAGGDESR